MKEQRWYTRQGNKVYVHNQPTLEGSQFYSEVTEEQLKYYKSNFNLRRAW